MGSVGIGCNLPSGCVRVSLSHFPSEEMSVKNSEKFAVKEFSPLFSVALEYVSDVGRQWLRWCVCLLYPNRLNNRSLMKPSVNR